MVPPLRVAGGLGTVLATLTLLALVQLVPGLDLLDFHSEEGRRVLPAREMIASGDYIVPTIWGHPYLAKPPGYFWILSFAFQLAGGVSEVVARSTSVLATLLTTWAVAWMGARNARPFAGLFAGALHLVALETVAKGSLAEIEASLTLYVFLSVALWRLGVAGSRGATLGATLCLAAALLCKGPAALVYILGAIVGRAVLRREARELVAPPTLCVLLGGAGLAGLWVAGLLREIGRAEVLAHWASEIGGQGGDTLVRYLKERPSYVFGTLLGFAPASFLVLLAWRTPEGRATARAPQTDFALWAAGAGWLVFLFFPGTNVRYALPCLPFLALAGGRLLDEAWTRRASALYTERVGRLASAYAWVGLLVALAVAVSLVVPLGEVRMDLVGGLLGLGALAAAVYTLRESLLARRATAALFLLPLCVTQIKHSQLDPPRRERHALRARAAELEARIPRDEPLHVAFWLDFNTLLYVEREVRYAPQWRQLEGPAWLLLEEAKLATLEREAEVVSRQTFPETENVLVRLAER